MAAAEDSLTTQPIDWVWWRRVAVVGYLVVLIGYIALFGVPLDRFGIMLWIIAGLSCAVVGRGWRAWGKLMLDWLPFQGLLFAYDFSRGFVGQYDTDGAAPRNGARNIIGVPLHTTFPIHADRFLFGGTLPTQWLQAHLHHPGGTRWYTVLFSLSYTSHFLVTPLVAVVLWIWWRDRFRAWVYCVLGLTLVGLGTYFLFPMSPPWLASEQGYISGAPVGRYSGEGWDYLHLKFASRALSVGQAQANLVAAMPSLHEAFTVLVAGFFCFGARWWVKCLLVCYPLLMAISLVYAGEHYVIDELVGAGFAICVLTGWRLLRRARLRRTGSAREVPHSEDLFSATDRSGDVVQRRGGQPHPVGAEGHRSVQSHPRRIGSADEMDAQVDVREHHLRRSHPGGAAVRGVDQHHE